MTVSDRELLHRTVGCGQLTENDAESELNVVLTGWVHRRRDLGKLIFVEMRDHTGFVQVVFDPSIDRESHKAAESLRLESVIGVSGKVVRREAVNPEHPTGTIEIMADRLVVHAQAEHVPFPVDETQEANEEARLTHRYVDLRRPRLQSVLRLRHRLAMAARKALDEDGFTEVETPILTRSTPEGARDYLVPSRVHAGNFYALPQSPQLFKQILMVAGFDRYYQFARCFRDEDLRADRQPEFTQIDIEIAFAEPETIYGIVEPLIVGMFREIAVDIRSPFARMTYAEAMSRFGTDRPDTRFGMELSGAGKAAESTGFRVFDTVLESGGVVRGLAVPNGSGVSRKVLDRYTEWAKDAGASGLIWIKLSEEGEPASSVLKAIGREKTRGLAKAVGASNGDLALLVADKPDACNKALGVLRLKVAREHGLIPDDTWDLLWIEDFPLLEWNEDEDRWSACHHPFTLPRWDEMEMLESQPGKVLSQAYDLVLNGTEIGGGSIRIHRRDIQQRVFKVLGISPEEAEAKFGFLLGALDAGAPPHGGIALGFDRICAMLSGSESIRDVIAFPKTTSGSCLMTRSPAGVDPMQLKELNLRKISGD